MFNVVMGFSPMTSNFNAMRMYRVRYKEIEFNGQFQKFFTFEDKAQKFLLSLYQREKLLNWAVLEVFYENTATGELEKYKTLNSINFDKRRAEFERAAVATCAPGNPFKNRKPKRQ